MNDDTILSPVERSSVRIIGRFQYCGLWVRSGDLLGLSLNDLFKELGVGLNEFRDPRTDCLFGDALMDPEGDGAEHLADHLGPFGASGR